jgi:hypothetical protein
MAAAAQSQIVASTQDLVLSLFSPTDRDNSSLRSMAQKAEALTSASTLTARLDAFVDFYSWNRERDGTICEPLSAAAFVGQETAEPDRKRSLVWTSILESS